MSEGPHHTFISQLRTAASDGAEAIEPTTGLPPLTTINKAELPHWPAHLLALRGSTAPIAIHDLSSNRARVLGGMGVAAPRDISDASK